MKTGAGSRSERIDIEKPEALVGYLRRTGRIGPDEAPRVRTLPGGVSNRTVRVERPSGETWVLKQALAKLRVPVDWFSDPRRIQREALGMEWLLRLAPPGTIMPLVFVDPAEDLLAMRAVPDFHENWKSVLLAGRIDREHFRRFATLLAAIHRESYWQGEELASIFEDRCFFESLRLEPYYSYTAVQAPAAAGFLEALAGETRERRICLVHGDYSPKNVLIHEGRLILLDHEVIHFGDPAFDVGFSLAHFLSKAHHLRRLRSECAEAAAGYWRTYFDALRELPWREELEERAIRHTLACLLARVAGRSPLDYLDPAERATQRNVVLALIEQPAATIPQLIDEFTGRL